MEINPPGGEVIGRVSDVLDEGVLVEVVYTEINMDGFRGIRGVPGLIICTDDNNADYGGGEPST